MVQSCTRVAIFLNGEIKFRYNAIRFSLKVLQQLGILNGAALLVSTHGVNRPRCTLGTI